ncbi:hypothetical protein CONLIGDRAFT_719550 [Coniochaeta ligniaria NRRL 30616]|uniref:Protein disulfide-isomerase n=1 Tax=Coniochaeta ligniaria NRRL 30616 TaxID=1408157 RepID=A0A1J7I6D1_9PEZI|nr:hypothetical protein CONLIGDRAFT_719550 [Coniochaeta ligniaria NRRL 30616]
MQLPALVVLPFWVIGQAIAWNHASEVGLAEAWRSQKYALVAFILPNHRASEALEPEWSAIEKEETDGRIISVDCAAEPKVCEQQGVNSFPAIRLYQDQGARMERYRGPRRASSIRSYLRRALRPVLSTVTDKNLTVFRGVDDVVFVAYLRPKDTVLRDWFHTLAKRYRDRFSFAVTMTEQPSSAVHCYNNVKGAEIVQGDLNAVDSLQHFVKLCSVPLIPELTRRNDIEYNSKDKSFVHYFVSSVDERDEYLSEMLPLAKKYEEYLQFTTIDATEYPEMLPVYGQQPGSTKVLSVYHPSNGQIFPQRRMEKLSAAVVEQFLLDIVGGKVRPWSADLLSGGDTGHDEL